MINRKINRDTLVAIINNKNDLTIALQQNWYRIPVKTQHTPPSVKNKSLKYIAFYQTSVFMKEAFIIKWYGKVTNITIVKRNQLLPEEPRNPKSNDYYYKIEFKECHLLPNPIVSLRHRRMLFVNTTYNRLLNSKEFNDLFIESPIEESLWRKFQNEKINAERQFMFIAKPLFYYLDFALFCRERNIDVECDGDKFHLSVVAVNYDKKRNNHLTKYGWVVLRYPTYQIKNNLNDVVGEIKETINRYGGLEISSINKAYKSFFDDGNQMDLFG
ncbi:MAG: endonuclease domain-containing protein [Bacteroidetes bacterium]|nr:endonuclease domain-containing protein [Bacteroidota bacterium]MBU2585516.1 endonuclease domain-containing protein [Bacteroidota bacterium]